MSRVLTAPEKTQDPGQEPSGMPTPKFELARSETVTLKRAKAVQAAQAHQQLERAPTERALDPNHVKRLVDRIMGGVWLPCQWATVTYEGKKCRMNGQHSSLAMVEAADFLPDEVVIHLDHYEARDREQMATLFRQFDPELSKRDAKDIAGAYQGLVKELDAVPKEKAKLGIDGAVWQEAMIEGIYVNKDEVYQRMFVPRYYPFLRWLDKILSPWKKVQELKKKGVIGAMYHTFLTSESGAQEFWPHVAKPDLPDDSDPRSVLSAELNRINEEKGRKGVTHAEYYAKCIKAWNAFRAGEKIRSLNINMKKGLPEIAA